MINSPDSTNPTDIRNVDLVAVVRSGRTLVAGAGVSGRGAISMLQDMSCPDIVLVDDSSLGQSVAGDFGIRCVSSAQAVELLADAAAVVTSPGWRPDSALFLAARDADVPVVGDVAVAFAGDRAELWGPKRQWLVVTGTNGKTTTTSMLAEMLGPRGSAVGNIGVALHDALKAEPRIEVLAAELSSFQLHWAPNLRPDAGVLLNLAEDHIDWHGSYDAYGRDKTRALLGETAIYGVDDADVVEHVERMRAAGELAGDPVGFTDAIPEANQVGVRDGMIVDRAFGTEEENLGEGVVIAPATGISPPGRAGVLDAVAATALARSIGTAPEAIATALGSFEVRAHRGQVVFDYAGVPWIDDSKATNPHAADAALSGHDRVVWIAGGQLKGADIAPLIAKHAHRLQAVVVLGADRQEICDALTRIAPAVPVTPITDTDKVDAMAKACMAAAEYASAGDVVLLAPAAASLDMYSGMAERGDLFAEWARKVNATDG
nr:UDP-N-acetylmuramoyl-L-alanine--D-glutamate ligase [Corynebacterium lactis]